MDKLKRSAKIFFVLCILMCIISTILLVLTIMHGMVMFATINAFILGFMVVSAILNYGMM